MITYYFDGTSCDIEATYHCHVFRIDTDTAPKREIEFVDIAGRSGALAFDRGKYANVEMKYRAVFYDHSITSGGATVNISADEQASKLKNRLLSQRGYQRLIDTDHSGEFYLAVISNDIEPYIYKDRKLVKLEMVFERKPQRYLTSGESVTTLTATGSITNPTDFPSQPLLRVYGDGVLGIGSQSITISGSDVYTDIDCEMMDAFKGTTNKNYTITLSGYKFPVLNAGANGISLDGITQVDITPRWWKL